MRRTPAQRLEHLATQAYGKQWMLPLARDTGYSFTQVFRWKKGETVLPRDHVIFSELAVVLRRKSKRLARLAEIARRLSV